MIADADACLVAQVGQTLAPCSLQVGVRNFRTADAWGWLLGKGPAELQQQGGFFFLRDGDARQGDGAPIGGVELDIHEHDFPQVLQHLPGG